MGHGIGRARCCLLYGSKKQYAGHHLQPVYFVLRLLFPIGRRAHKQPEITVQMVY